MHAVLLNQYYPPDAAPTGVMLQAVAERLVRQGHEVTVLCAHGGYAEKKFASVQGSEFREEEEVNSEQWTVSSGEEMKFAGDQSSVCREDGNANAGNHSKVNIHRIGATRFGRGSFVGKLMDYLSYYVGVAWRLMWMKPRPGRVVALTTPPYLSVLARMLSKLRGADHAHWVMDIYPDVMVAHGMLREGGVLHRMLAMIARWGMGGKRCAAVVTLGPCMAERLRRSFKFQVSSFKGEEEGADDAFGRDKHGQLGEPSLPSFQHSTFNIQHSTLKIHWVPLWSGAGEAVEGHRDDAVRLRRERGWGDGEMVVMYSGNMGLGHRFGEILEVAEGWGDLPGRDAPATAWGGDALATRGGDALATGMRLVFYGRGKRRGEVERFVASHPGCRVELHDYAPAERLDAHLRSADVHLVSLDAEWTGTMIPSKLQGVFAAERPVIFIGSGESGIGRWVVESGGGVVVAPGDVEGLREALERMGDVAVRERMGMAAAGFAARHFNPEANAGRVAEILAGD